jgi:hypothetical protein
VLSTRSKRRVPLEDGIEDGKPSIIFKNFFKHSQAAVEELHAFGDPSKNIDDSQLSRSAMSYTARLDRTLKLLQDRLKEQEAALEKVSPSP